MSKKARRLSEVTMAEEFPVEGVELTFLLVVSDLSESVRFYRDVLGAELFREYGGTSAVFQFQGSWLLLVTGGPPTEGKPGITFALPADPSRIDHQLTMWVPDCREAYETLRQRGAEFLTAPVERDHEIRCFFRDPDGRLLEISELK
jgi:catechol 2,3-dioxygenase-like lactoylglutathione lyase family enzyme